MATPQTRESTAATANTLRSSEACSILGMLVGAMRRKILSRPQEKNTPNPPAEIASRILSANASRASLDWPAPKAARISNSRDRAAMRASSSPEAFTHTINRNTPLAARTSQAVRDASPTWRSRKFRTRALTGPVSGGNSLAPASIKGAIAAAACCAVTPGFRRPIVVRYLDGVLVRVEGAHLLRQEQVRFRERGFEARRQYAHDAHGIAIDLQHPARGPRIAAEAPLPQGMADNGDRRRSLPILFRGEITSQHDGYAKHVEEVRLNPGAVQSFRPLFGQVAGAAAAQDTGDGLEGFRRGLPELEISAFLMISRGEARSAKGTTSPKETRRSGSAYGRGRNRMRSKTENSAVADPVPRARTAMTPAANPGLRRQVRRVNRASCRKSASQRRRRVSRSSSLARSIGSELTACAQAGFFRRQAARDVVLCGLLQVGFDLAGHVGFEFMALRHTLHLSLHAAADYLPGSGQSRYANASSLRFPLRALCGPPW